MNETNERTNVTTENNDDVTAAKEHLTIAMNSGAQHSSAFKEQPKPLKQILFTKENATTYTNRHTVNDSM